MRALLLLAFLPLPQMAASCAGVESQLQAAKRALEQSNLAEAEHILMPLQASEPPCAEFVLALARLHGAKGDTPEAQNLFFRYTGLAPKDAKGYYYFARFLFSKGDYGRADTLSEVAISLDPGYPDALTLKGQLLLMKGQNDRAVELLRKASELDPKNAEAHFQLGTFFDRNKRPAEAVEQFEKVVSINPRDARAWDYLALNLEPLGEVDKTEAAYKKGIEVNEGPRFDSFLDYNYGRFLLKRNRLSESKKHLDRAVELAPQTRAVFYERAKVNFRQENYEAARQDAEKALSLPDRAGIIIDLQLYYLLERIYNRLGEKALAQKYAELSRTTAIPVRRPQR